MNHTIIYLIITPFSTGYGVGVTWQEKVAGLYSLQVHPLSRNASPCNRKCK